MTSSPIALSGKTVVLTGRFTAMPRKQLAAALTARGAVVASSVTAGVDLLFAGERAGSKRRKAEALGIPIHTEDELLASLSDGAASAPTPAGPAPLDDLADGQSIEVQGSATRPYRLRNMGGVYSCSCPAWRNQSLPIERRTCKHLRALRGAAAEQARIGPGGTAAPTRTVESADAPGLLLAMRWEPHVDPTGWWMSEKLDGVRAYWDGTRFISRLGNPYLAPDWFTDDLPDVPLDGELWLGRGLFQRTVSIVRRHDGSELWREVRFRVFDVPAHEGVFEARQAHLRTLFPDPTSPEAASPGATGFADVVTQIRCDSVDHLRAEQARIEGLGGEGVMLRQPGSEYVSARSSTLLKVKSFFDAEARIEGYKPGAGRHKGRVGALLVIGRSGERFAVGTGLSDRQRENPPPVGSVICFRYQERTDDGIPRFPSFVGVREDADW